ncbi:hypothetical protein IMCC26134_00740 [Verrucomicrobia bacterium IMCC26134]|nr:hypothetical protein IMCC26134_00740 [Verrucomicrobia bacterium IMCC26134]
MPKPARSWPISRPRCSPPPPRFRSGRKSPCPTQPGPKSSTSRQNSSPTTTPTNARGLPGPTPCASCTASRKPAISCSPVHG